VIAAAKEGGRELRANTLTWLALCGLTLVSFFVSDSLVRAALVPILAVAAVKCSLVGFQFMGLRAAHPLLRACFLVVFGALVFALWVAHRHG
jgi:hypothetical protein